MNDRLLKSFAQALEEPQPFEALHAAVTQAVKDGNSRRILADLLDQLGKAVDPKHNETIHDVYECLMGYAYPEIRV